MSVIAIPTETTKPHWDQVTTLDGVDYQLAFRYNQRENVYYVIFADTLGNIINGGIKIVANWLLLQSVIDPNMPPGELFALSTGPNDDPPGYGEMGIGQRVVLYYIERADLQAAGLDTNRDPLALLPHS
jgi:hypothetical protein